MSNTLNIELGGTNIRWELFDGAGELVREGRCKIIDYSGLADFLDATFDISSDIGELLIATPLLNGDGIIPNSDNKFQALLPVDHPLQSISIYPNDFEVLASAAENANALRLVDLFGNPINLTSGEQVKFYFDGPGTGTGSASALSRNNGTNPSVINSEGQHTPISTHTLADRRLAERMSDLIDGAGALSQPSFLLRIAKHIESGADSSIFFDVDADRLVPVPNITHEQGTQGMGLELIYRAVSIECGKKDAKKPIEQIIGDAFIGNDDVACRTIEYWARNVGIMTLHLMQWHFNASSPRIIVLGGGVIPNMLKALSSQKKPGENIKDPLFQKLFVEPFRNGLATYVTRNKEVDKVFSDMVATVQISIPTCDNPGLVGLRFYAAQRRRQRQAAEQVIAKLPQSALAPEVI